MSFRNYGDYKKEDPIDHLIRFCAASKTSNKYQSSTNYYASSAYSESSESSSSTFNGVYMGRVYYGATTMGNAWF